MRCIKCDSYHYSVLRPVPRCPARTYGRRAQRAQWLSFELYGMQVTCPTTRIRDPKERKAIIMPSGLLWYANMTYQPMDCMASIHEVWRLIMRSIVFTKCKGKRAPKGSSSKTPSSPRNASPRLARGFRACIFRGRLFSLHHSTRLPQPWKHHDGHEYSWKSSG